MQAGCLDLMIAMMLVCLTGCELEISTPGRAAKAHEKKKKARK